jgi:hypothetical protein
MTNRKFPPDTLHLVLAYKWYDMIERGVKLEEYREVTPYWEKRIWGKRPCIRKVAFQKGYKKNAPTMIFEIASIMEVNKKHDKHYKSYFVLSPNWGYNGKDCYIIRLGERIYTTASNGTTAQEGKERR